jgi:hypothetical protein
MAVLHNNENKKADTAEKVAAMTAEFQAQIHKAKRDMRDAQSVVCWGVTLPVEPVATIFPCTRCMGPTGEKNSRCADCLIWCDNITKNVTEFDADMPCPWCDAEGPHFLREAHPAPKYDAMPELRHRFAAFKRDTQTLEHGYAQYVRQNADVVVEAFGESTPVRVIMNDPATRAAARKLQPPRVRLDSPKLSKYDHPEAKTIRTCHSCGKEWSQK